MKLSSFTSKANKPLFAMLDSLLAQYGFKFEPQDAPGRPDIAEWEKPLGPTLKAAISINLSSALPPNTWSLDPIIMIDSAYVAHWYNTLRLGRDFYPAGFDYVDSDYLQALRFFPAHIRWQERFDLEFPTLKARQDTIGSLKDEFTDVYEHYALPVLERIGDPLALAEFQLRAETEFRATRIKWDEARYMVSNPYISTALLFDEAGQTARAVSFLEQRREEWSRLWSGRDPATVERAHGRFDRLLEHLSNKASLRNPDT